MEVTAQTSPPTGLVTFLFTDIEGSTWLLQHLEEEYDAVLADHHRILREVWDAHDGYEVSTEGDAFFVAFADAPSAIVAAFEAQRRLGAHAWPMDEPVRVRMGLHTGGARVLDNDYVGLDVHQAARIASSAHGSQVIVSEATKEAVAGALPPGTELADLGLHRLKDLAQPVRLYQLAHPDLPADLPPPRTLTVMPNNFPFQVTTFVGREDDIAGVKEALASSRLVTLIGAGGVGKTRLALQVGAEILDDLPDGAWLVDLAPVGDADLVTGEMAGAVGVREQPGRPLIDTLTDHLLAKRSLIVLDNCEHLMDACAKVVHHLLASCSQLKVLATSREALNVYGEWAWRLRSLGVPESAEDLGALARTEAVRLFVQRARSARGDFELTQQNAAAITRVCRCLDGLPLAIELAAARVRTMTVQDVAGRLDDRFRLLTGGTRTALRRQRTLEATVAWSYELLSEPERTVFDRLSVFAGGCTAEAAERVCSDEEVASFEVLDLLARLAERSLVVIEESAGGRTRYRMLETLRQFGRERLVERGEVDSLKGRHLEWGTERAGSMPVQTGTSLAPDVLVEEDNLRAALEWAIETGRLGAGLRIIATVWFGHFHERARWYDRLLGAVEDVPVDIRSRALTAAGGLAFMMGEWSLGADRYRRGAEAAAEAGIPLLESLCLSYEGTCRWALGELDSSLRLMEEGLRVARQSGEGEGERRALMFLGWWYSERDLERAEQLASEVEAKTRESATPFERAHALELLGFVRSVTGDLSAGGAELAEAVRRFEDVQRNCSAHAFESAASWAAMCDRLELGAELWGAADRIREETSDKPRPWEREVQERWLPRIREGLAPDRLEEARARGRAMPYEQAVAHAERALRSPGA